MSEAKNIPVKGSIHRDTLQLLLEIALEPPRRRTKYRANAYVDWKLIEKARAHLLDAYNLNADEILREAERRVRELRRQSSENQP